MGKFDQIKSIWNKIKSEWKTRYRLVFSNEDTHKQEFVIRRITIQRMFVVAIIAAFVIILLTTLLIAITPLRHYISGYTDQKDYKLYKQTAARVDSLEQIVEYNQAFIDNFTAMIEGKAPTIDQIDDDAESTPNTHTTIRDKKRMAEAEELEGQADLILGRISEDNTTQASTPGLSEARISALTIYPPAIGAVTRPFDASKNHYGVDIAATRNSVIACIADGVVIAAHYSATDGYVIIVQHPGNLISVYKRNAALLKQAGARVQAGDPIAAMGNKGSDEGTSSHLHFELWYNGFPINPLDYLVIE